MSQKKSPADDLICPITLELPWDPVTAADGRIYEKAAIEEHFRSNQTYNRSPVTNAHINGTLFPAPQIRSLIETLIETGAIDGDLVSNWNEKVKQKNDREETLKKAEGGDAEAMYDAGEIYEHGSHLVKKDMDLALTWYKKAHEAGNIKGTALLGYHICNPHCGYIGSGSFGSPGYRTGTGLMYTCIAAAQGSNHAAYHLGMALSGASTNHTYGINVNTTEAVPWLEKAVGDCWYDHLNDAEKNTAQNKLSELSASGAGLPVLDQTSTGFGSAEFAIGDPFDQTFPSTGAFVFGSQGRGGRGR